MKAELGKLLTSAVRSPADTLSKDNNALDEQDLEDVRTLAFKIAGVLTRESFQTFREWFPELSIVSEYKAIKKMTYLAV